MGPLSFDRSRRADNFGAGISLWDALSVDFEAVLGFSNILSIFQNIDGICLINIYTKY